jgi:prepilin-type N-terminal cleavage/methylation domain-containing protein
MFRRRRRRSARVNARRGFTLIEIMVAMTMLSIILLSLARTAAVLSARAKSNGIRANVSAVLQREGNKFGAMTYTTLSTFSTANVTGTVGSFSYTRRLTITVNNTKRISVKVVIVPASDTTKKDSLMFDRIRTTSSPLCTTC